MDDDVDQELLIKGPNSTFKVHVAGAWEEEALPVESQKELVFHVNPCAVERMGLTKQGHHRFV